MSALSSTAPKIQVRILLAAKYLLLYEKTKINDKESGVGPFKKTKMKPQLLNDYEPNSTYQILPSLIGITGIFLKVTNVKLKAIHQINLWVPWSQPLLTPCKRERNKACMMLAKLYLQLRCTCSFPEFLCQEQFIGFTYKYKS